MQYNVDKVFFVAPKPRFVERITNEVEYRPEVGWKWVQRLCFWLLRKIGAFKKVNDIAEIRRVRIETDTFMERLHEMRKNMYSWGFKPNLLLIGRGDYCDMMKEIYCNPSMSSIRFEAQTRIGYKVEDINSVRGWRVESKVIGLSVVIIPNMEGVLLLDEAQLR